MTLEECQSRIDYHCSAALHYFTTWHLASQYHLEILMELCEQRDAIREIEKEK